MYAFQVADLSLRFMEAAQPLTTSDTRSVQEWAGQLSNMPEASKLAVRLHLLSLLFEEMRIPCAQAVESSGVLDLLVRLLAAAQECLVLAGKEPPTPK